jgi:hypothetical protein
MTYHPHAPGALGQPDKFVGFGERGRERFFDKHIHAGLHQLAGNVQVLNGRNGNRGGVGLCLAQKVIDAGEDASAELSGYGGRPPMVVVDDAEEVDFTFGGQIAVDARVVAPEGANPDGGGFECSCQWRVPGSSV